MVSSACSAFDFAFESLEPIPFSLVISLALRTGESLTQRSRSGQSLESESTPAIPRANRPAGGFAFAREETYLGRARMRTRTEIPIDSRRALAALCASNVLGVLVLYVIPLLVGATSDGFHAREGTSGIVSSWELGVMATASMWLAARYESLDKRRWSLAGMALFLLGYLASVWSLSAGQWGAFLIARGVVGAGEGILFGVSSGLAAQTPQPDRTFAWFSGSHIASSIVCFWALPMASESLGPPGAFLAMGVVGLLAAPLILWTPDPSMERDDRPAEPKERFGGTAVLLLLSVGSLNLGLNTLFPFTERIGLSIGFTLPEIGRILSWGAVLSILGPIAAGRFAASGGRTLTLGFGALSQVVATFIFVYSASHALWAGSYVVSSAALMYFLPLLYGLVAYYDRTGRINAAAASVSAWTSAVAPLLAGLLLNAGGSYRLLGWVTASFYAAIFVFACRPSRAAEEGLRSG
jgi:predicted MFS family arabinose efflux permease